MLNEYGEYCIYLRKSRADREAEQRGEGETLARHEKILMDLARRLHISIKSIYREVVSGETISARPSMQQLLHEVENGMWDGVLVVEVERLARGDTIDQGIVSRAFQFSDTKIITPTKIYDPQNEFDEEYFEFGLFMSRREYKTIKRRLNNGRISSVNEGKYVGNKSPYGYMRVKLPKEKGWTLEPIPEQAAVVQMIFNWYVNGDNGERLGVSKITRKLNDLGIPSKFRNDWSPSSIRDILSNPTYIGKVRWNRRKTQKKIIDGIVVLQRPRNDDYILQDGRHPAIISTELYEAAQKIRSKNPPRPVNGRNTIKNPLAGIVYCGGCGRSMVRRPYTDARKDSLMCAYTSCSNVSSRLELVESAVIQGLWDLLERYELNTDLKDDNATQEIMQKETLLENRQDELEQLTKQKTRLYDFLEQGVYTSEVFLERSEELRKKTLDCSAAIQKLEEEIEKECQMLERRENFVPRCRHILEHYWEWDVQTRNNVLKELVEKIVYTKMKKNARGHADDITFSLTIYPRIL